MTKDEALRLALEALVMLLDNYVPEATEEDISQVETTITAIKAALEAKDEPVACKECHLKDTVYDLLGDLKVANLKLSVRSQRTWVGLTDEEVQTLRYKIDSTAHWTYDEFARAIEAKLKDKNI